MAELIDTHPVIDDLLDRWRDSLGAAWEPYRGHVYRVYNFAAALLAQDDSLAAYGGVDAALEIIAVADCFHDAGIWLDDSFDYLPPSRRRAAAWLEENGKTDWVESVEAIIEYHHKLTPYRGPHAVLVEPFRKADLVDVSLGTIRAGLPKGFVREVRRAFPNAGFHKLLVRESARWWLRHPLNPAPMMRR